MTPFVTRVVRCAVHIWIGVVLCIFMLHVHWSGAQTGGGIESRPLLCFIIVVASKDTCHVCGSSHIFLHFLRVQLLISPAMPDSQLRLMLELGAAACAVCVPVGIAWWYSTRTPSCKPPPAWQDPISLDVWSAARCVWESAPELRGCLQPIFQSHSLDEAVVTILAELLAQAPAMPTWRLKKALMSQAGKGALPQLMRSDLNAVIERDPAATSPLIPLLHFKGFQALQTHRIAHELWCSGQRPLALWLQGRVSQTFQLDIHPAAQLGGGLLFDHATGGSCCARVFFFAPLAQAPPCLSTGTRSDRHYYRIF